ncbi:MAG: hypothetical protein R8K47_04200 [Mariprofundaceae bacterium]
MALLLVATTSWAGGMVVQDIEIIGLEHTNPRVIHRELPFAPGAPWREGMAALAQRRLLNLGLFSEASVLPPDKSGIVRVLVHERWSLWLLPRLTRKDNGASSAGFALDEYNLWGLNHGLHLGWRKDTGRNFTGRGGVSRELGYEWNRIWDSRWSLALTANWGERLAADRQFGATLSGQDVREHLVSLTFSRAFGAVPGEGWGLRFGTVIGGLRAIPSLGSARPGLDAIRRRQAFAGLEYRDITDHIDWIEGERMDWTVTVTERAWGASYGSTRQQFSWARYRRIGSTRHTLNLRLGGGAIGGDARTDGLFDIGHRNGVRGYYPGEIVASSWLLGSAEGRWLFPGADNLQWATFSDVAWLNGLVESIGGRRWFVGAGAGLRWTLRWLVRGTVRLDAAWGFQTRRWRFYLGTGQAF